LALLWREVSDAAIFGNEKIIKAKYQAKNVCQNYRLAVAMAMADIGLWQ